MQIQAGFKDTVRLGYIQLVEVEPVVFALWGVTFRK
jgi:hypothetical protein